MLSFLAIPCVLTKGCKVIVLFWTCSLIPESIFSYLPVAALCVGSLNVYITYPLMTWSSVTTMPCFPKMLSYLTQPQTRLLSSALIVVVVMYIVVFFPNYSILSTGDTQVDN